MVQNTFKRNTDYVYVKGKASWAKLKRLNDWGKWGIQLHPDPASLEIIRQLQAEGMKNTIKKDDDGWFVSFSRPFEKEVTDRNGLKRKIGFTAPEVINDQGEPITDDLGNGSDVTLKLEVYQHGTPGGGKAKAARLLGVKVHNLVPYTRKDFSEEQEKVVKGLDEETVSPGW